MNLTQVSLSQSKRTCWKLLVATSRLVLALSLVLTPFLPTVASAAPARQSETSTKFTIRIENISGNTVLPGPLAPGVWAVHDAATRPFFDEDMADRGLGLAALAEDGNPAELVSNLSGVTSSGIFNTPVGSDGPGPLLPGGAYQFHVNGDPGDNLSFATMLVQTNDFFVSPDSNGIALFDGDGNPISGDVTARTPLWDVGSERDEAPGMGPNQAPRQAGPNTGAAEGVVSVFDDTTRSLPLAGHIVDVQIEEADGTYTFKITNVSATSGAIDTPIAPLFYATHNDQWSLFETGHAASAGLEMQAEDGSPAGLVEEHTGATGTGTVGAAGDGPALTGDGYTFSVTPTSEYPYVTFSGMVVQTNDAFFAPSAKGIALLNRDGTLRSAAHVMADINRELAIWDAGTEANEVPGVGLHQAPRQAGPNTGPADPIPGVRIYSDATNDLAGENAGGFIDISIAPLSQVDKFLVTIKNTSDTTVYPGVLTPVVWATHNSNTGLFSVGDAASAGLEMLAEDGDPSGLAGELAAADDVVHSGVVNLPISKTRTSAEDAGPLLPGDYYQFAIQATPDAPYFSFAQMIVPSNDTFAAFRGSGIRLYDEAGHRRSESDLAAEIAKTPLAWDAGTEQNQAGAAGPDQAPRQARPNTGADEGNGTVRLVENAPVWDYPTAEEVVRITITPDDGPNGGGGGDSGGDGGGDGNNHMLFISSDRSGSIAGIDYVPADILGYNTVSSEWSMILDGSDLGIKTNNVRAFDWMEDGSLLLSFAYPMWIEGLGWVDDSDIVKFRPSTLGETSSGSFEWYFDGSDVGLTHQGEDIDALNIAPNGDLIISTLGGYRVDGARGRDEDLIRFTPASVGEETAGTWTLEFDGSDVGLTRGSEDVRGSFDAGTGEIQLVARNSFSVQSIDGSTLEGDGNDIFACAPSSLGDNTECSFSLVWDGDAHGMTKASHTIDAFTFGPSVELSNAQSVSAASVAAPTGEMIELVGEEMAVEAAADVEADEMDMDDELEQQIHIPFVAQ